MAFLALGKACYVFLYLPIYLSAKWDIQRSVSFQMQDKPLGCKELKKYFEKEIYWLFFTLHVIYNESVLSGVFKEQNQPDGGMSIEDHSESLQINSHLHRSVPVLSAGSPPGRWGFLCADGLHQGRSWTKTKSLAT